MKIAFITGFGKRYGSGHLVRIKNFKKKLELNGYKSNIFIINKNKDILDLDLENYDLIIKDSRDSSKKIFKKLQNYPLIVLDDYFKFKEKKYLYILNAIPSLKRYGNTNNIKYLISNKESNNNEKDNINFNKRNNEKILITFGLLDPYNLSIKFANFINSCSEKDIFKIFNINSFKQIVFILPERIYNNYQIKENLKKIQIFNKFTVKKNIENFSKYLETFEFIITHFGLTLFESLSIGKKIILVNPTRYHNRLAIKYFNDINAGLIKKIKVEYFYKIVNFYKTKNFKDKIDDKNQEKENFRKIYFTGDNLVTSLIKTFEKKYINKSEIICPICLSNKIATLERKEKFNLYKCKKCGVIFKYDFIEESEKLKERYSNPSYFKSEYEKNYGKTYIDDRKNILKINNKRIEILDKIFLKKFLNQKNIIQILDIGSAYGFFLEDIENYINYNYINKKFNDKRIVCEGIELNVEGKSISNKKGFHIYNNDFLIANLNKKYDLITSWFTIEHIENINAVFSKVHKLLNKNGIFSFSIPSINGPTYKFNKNKYLETRPEDHYFDFTKKSIKMLLKKHGFKLLKLEIQNPHFERFKKNKKILSFIIGKKVYTFLAKKLKFSDTIEVYAKKI